MKPLFLFGFTTLLLAAGPRDWPGWRGPNADGTSQIDELPLSWSKTENIAWSVEIEGRGHSSPVVFGDRLFLTTDLEGEEIAGASAVKHMADRQVFVHPQATGGNRRHTLKVLCFDARSGKQLWSKVAYDGRVFDDVAKFNTYASPTPVTDGKDLYVYFESQGLYKYDFDGKLLWKMSLGGIATMGVGTGVSPVLAGDKVIILADQDEGENSFIAAVSKSDGKVAWKTPRPKTSLTWTTPAFVDGVIVVPATETVIAYDPANGRELWRTEGLESNVVHTPVAGNGMVFVSAGYPKKKVMALRLKPKEGEDRVAWRYDKGTGYIPSAILSDGLLYVMTDAGLQTCLDANTGQPKYEGKRFPTGSKFTSPPVAFGGRLLYTSNDGDTHVVKAGPVHEVLRTNSLEDSVYASLALAGDSIYIRSAKKLYCIRQTKKS